MSITKNPNLRKNAKELRKNMTREESKIWYNFLSGLEVRVKRQQVIGEYIVDFYCPQKRTIIEIDGIQHRFDKETRENDKQRDEYFKSCGIRVLRYTNFQINEEFEKVCEDIEKYLFIK